MGTAGERSHTLPTAGDDDYKLQNVRLFTTNKSQSSYRRAVFITVTEGKFCRPTGQ